MEGFPKKKVVGRFTADYSKIIWKKPYSLDKIKSKLTEIENPDEFTWVCLPYNVAKALLLVVVRAKKNDPRLKEILEEFTQ